MANSQVCSTQSLTKFHRDDCCFLGWSLTDHSFPFCIKLMQRTHNLLNYFISCEEKKTNTCFQYWNKTKKWNFISFKQRAGVLQKCYPWAKTWNTINIINSSLLTIASFVTSNIAMYFALVLDRATVHYFLASQVKVALVKVKIYPIYDVLSSKQSPICIHRFFEIFPIVLKYLAIIWHFP